MRPIVMPPNQLDHSYLGGSRIIDLRGPPAMSERSLDEWLASAVDELHAVLPAEADPFSRVHVARPMKAVEVGPGFRAAIVLEGGGDLDTDDDLVSVSRGDVLAVPLAGPWQVPAGVTAIVCRPWTDGPGQAV